MGTLYLSRKSTHINKERCATREPLRLLPSSWVTTHRSLPRKARPRNQHDSKIWQQLAMVNATAERWGSFLLLDLLFLLLVRLLL